MYNTENERKVASQKSSLAYDKTIKGFLVNKFAGMKYRVNSPKKPLYFGLSIMTKDEFYKWSLGDVNFIALFREWVDSDYQLKLTPSVDRVVSSEGYILSNVEWVTFSENCARVRRNITK